MASWRTTFLGLVFPAIETSIFGDLPQLLLERSFEHVMDVTGAQQDVLDLPFSHAHIFCLGFF